MVNVGEDLLIFDTNVLLPCLLQARFNLGFKGEVYTEIYAYLLNGK